jgi:hypothetical protein
MIGYARVETCYLSDSSANGYRLGVRLLRSPSSSSASSAPPILSFHRAPHPGDRQRHRSPVPVVLGAATVAYVEYRKVHLLE